MNGRRRSRSRKSSSSGSVTHSLSSGGGGGSSSSSSSSSSSKQAGEGRGPAPTLDERVRDRNNKALRDRNIFPVFFFRAQCESGAPNGERSNSVTV